MAFSELEKRKHKIFLEKLRNIEQKPYGASLSANIQSGVRDSGFVTEQLSGNWKHFFFFVQLRTLKLSIYMYMALFSF